ncbi:HupE/UreJ family protein [Paenibacillus flagellatus]|nr:HupE/UreJ family protein [Paenibacillus flagellatus]
MKLASLWFSTMICIGAILAFLSPAGAHPLNNGYSELTVDDRTVRYELFLPEIRLLRYDADGNGTLTAAELEANGDAIRDELSEKLVLAVGSEPMTLVMTGMEAEEKDAIRGVSFHLAYTAPERVESFTIHYNLLFDDVDPDHLNFAVILDGEDVEQAVFDDANRTFYYAASSRHGSAAAVLAEYAKLGVEHIWEGTDHLLFVLSLVLAAARFRDIVRYVTAFTVAHSITLFLAATGRAAFPAVWIESLIAATILYVALENVWIRQVRWRTLLTFAFGLVHGLGFASVLGEIGLPADQYAGSLIAFNAGVELGQLLFIAAAMPLLAALRRTGRERQATVAASAAIAAVAAFWLLQRTGLIGGGA